MVSCTMMPRPHTIRLQVRREHNTHGLESSLLRGRDPPAPPPCIMRRCITDKVWIETAAIHTWRAGHTPRSTILLFPVDRLQAQCGKTLPLAHTRSLKRQIARHVSKLPSSCPPSSLPACLPTITKSPTPTGRMARPWMPFYARGSCFVYGDPGVMISGRRQC